MEFVVFLVFMVLIVLLIVLLSFRNDVRDRFHRLNAQLELLKGELKQIRETGTSSHTVEPIKPVQETISHKAPVVQSAPVEKKEIEKPVVPPPPPVITPPPIEVKPKEEVKPTDIETLADIVASARKQTPPPVIHKPIAPKKPGFFERNPDLEKFIGENLVNKIGIGMLVLGVGYFVKYAIDQDWIGEIGRVFIGIICGGILLGIAHRLRKKFAAFSSVLVGGGIAVLYLTIYIAFHDYKIFDQTTAFVLMLIITAFAVILAISYNRMELAILSILGGFASPFMVSTGEGNYVVLFTYILILDVGMLVLAYYKKWNPVNIVAYVFTLILFASWLGDRFDGNDGSMVTGAMIFATLFYLVFFAMNIVNNIKERTKFKALEISMLLSNTFFYYAAGIAILNNPIGKDFQGLFTACLGVFNFIFAYLLYKNKSVDRNLVFLLIGLVLTFISLAAPVQLEGNYITLFWAAETVLLLWLSQKSGIRLMKLASLALMGLMIISLIMDWQQIYLDSSSDLSIVLNKGYITGLFALASIALTLRLIRNETSENAEHVTIYRSLLMVSGIVILYTSQLLELRHQLFESGFGYATENVIIGAYNMLFILGLVLAEKKLVKEETLRNVFALFGIIALVLYAVFYHQQTIIVRNEFVLSNGSVTGFAFHYILLALLLVIAFVTLKKIQKLTELNQQTGNAYSWIYVFFFVFIASAELDHLVVVAAGATDLTLDHILTQNHKIGFPILWGLASFLLMFLGFKMKKKHLRIISLTLFLITLLKLFIVDIRGISKGGKIAAFISLSILLLVVSFMYQRLKRMLSTNEVPSREENQKTE
jgi:uncharacterized membrane protein